LVHNGWQEETEFEAVLTLQTPVLYWALHKAGQEAKEEAKDQAKEEAKNSGMMKSVLEDAEWSGGGEWREWSVDVGLMIRLLISLKPHHKQTGSDRLLQTVVSPQ
jgi:hypothetical protein